MDCYSTAIDGHLEEEDGFADQLKEYYYYSTSVAALCSRHQMTQFQMEKAEANVALQKSYKDKYDGNDHNVLTKFWGKWTGASETLEEKREKIRTMDRNIVEAEENLRLATDQLA